jgi:hypothetical protein
MARSSSRGGMISFSLSGSTEKTQRFLQKMGSGEMYRGLESLAQQGVSALQANTPTDSGLTAASWSYLIEIKGSATVITWVNTHVESGVNIAIILQYGHATGTGGFVAGRDYINPSIKPIFDEIANEVWRKVTSA